MIGVWFYSEDMPQGRTVTVFVRSYVFPFSLCLLISYKLLHLVRIKVYVEKNNKTAKS